MNMDTRTGIMLLIGIAAIILAGCTAQTASPPGTTAGPAIPASPAVTGTPGPTPPVSPVQGSECSRPEDCIPAECCHPTGCMPATKVRICNMMCTNVCQGPLDCGAGSCGCVEGSCRIVPSGSATAHPATPATGPAVTINASPLRYSPMMSSTPGIGLEPVVAGFSAANGTFTWTATYGRFLAWDAPDYRVNELGSTATSHGGKIYWSFSDPVNATATPVTITVTARDTASGRVLGNATLMLDWESGTMVRVRQ